MQITCYDRDGKEVNSIYRNGECDCTGSNIVYGLWAGLETA